MTNDKEEKLAPLLYDDKCDHCLQFRPLTNVELGLNLCEKCVTVSKRLESMLLATVDKAVKDPKDDE